MKRGSERREEKKGEKGREIEMGGGVKKKKLIVSD